MRTVTTLLTGSFVRFLLVGVLNTLVGLSASFVFFNALHLNYWISTFAGNGIGAVVSYILNRTFTFRSTASIGSNWWKFGLVILVCYGFSYGASWLMAVAIGAYWPEAQPGWLHNGAILAGNGLYTIGNYAGHKYFTFRTISKTDRAS
ncbi:GtrA family protein [Paenibacillus roseipurpureus]|uniref:GtrA family protein n=1 Tax=Paenibacillus roseopurpureus TaxID=2918901 RepID=A0AA96LMA2_9BACL|nr:GtrA family protein [Paenibacillus sp. MBLB1832]WNR43741.1 GtrA family protein [Paenibacillus sp. MBLB1832]